MSAPGQPPDGPERSPLLLSAGTSAPRGQKRLNTRRVLMAGGAVIALLVIAPLGYALWRSTQSAHPGMASGDGDLHAASADSVLAGAPSNVHAAAFHVGKPPEKPPATAPASAPPADHAAPHDAGPSDPGPAEQARQAAWQQYYQELAEVEKARFSAAMAAQTADTSLTPGQGGEAGMGQPGGAMAAASAQSVAVAGGPPGVPAGLGGAGGYAVPAISPAAQQRAFLNGGGDLSGASDQLQATLQGPKPLTVMQGTPIAATMDQGINSDTPGMIRAHVSETVYDSATGRFPLIPQGSTLVGAYDNSVFAGQTRVVVVWHRIIFPDTGSIDLGGWEGADQSGYAGFHDQVNSHFWSKLGNALLISIGGAAAQLSQGAGGSTYGGYNAQQIAAAGLGQQFAELGQEYARAGLAIPNTLEIRPGYRFIVMAAKDVTLPPYVDQRTSGAIPVSIGPVLQ